ncbi:hypothetical protein GF385_04660 [Candidatus Dependentiae bacterium]|nr:hypothetical protein [Candidatus Dependentiae bacterium]
MLKKNRASILIFTLLILSIITMLTQQLVRSVLIGYEFSSNQLRAEQARFLALGGIQLAISQLNIDKIQERDIKKKLSEKEKFKKFLLRILPNINRWQTFDLKEDLDGIDGQIKLCITCENGKININEAFDFNKKEFKPEYKKILNGLEIKGKLKTGEIEKRLTEFLKNRKKPLDDISQLSNISGLQDLNIFYEPPNISEYKKKSSPNSEIYLQDLFTIWTEKKDINLLFLSDSMLAVLGLRRPLADDSENLKDKFNNFIKNFNKDWLKNWEPNWKNFSPIYGRNTKILKSSEKILSKEFGPKFYSVLSCGKIENVEQKLLVVLKEVVKEKKEQQNKKVSAKEKLAEEKGKKEKSSKTFQIIRMYWL